jgi:signal transduction histidine kinase
VDGEASAEDLSKLRPHVRTCLACRAALREYRAAPSTAAALVPVAAFAASRRSPLSDAAARLLESVTGWVQKGHAFAEMASVQKVAAVAASTAVVAGGGVATVQHAADRPDRATRVASAPEPRRAAAPSVPVAPPTAPPAAQPPAPRPPSAAERRELRERLQRQRAQARARAERRRTPPAQQEFEPAFAAGEPAAQPGGSATATAAAASPAPEPVASETPPASGGGAEEFAP